MTALWGETTSSSSSESKHQQIMDNDIAKLQAKARALLEKSKAKLAAQSSSNDDNEDETTTAVSTLPFFAAPDTTTTTPNRRQAVTKTINEATGLITTDGEKMAQLSEGEEWESRRLLEVFENELSEDDDVYSLASQQLASRDVAAQITNLRKELHTGDFRRIFDKRNRFIGEDN